MKTIQDLEQIRKRARKWISIRSGDQRATVVVSGPGARQVTSSILDGLSIHEMTDVAVVQRDASQAQSTVELMRPNMPCSIFCGLTPEAASSVVVREIGSTNP